MLAGGLAAAPEDLLALKVSHIWSFYARLEGLAGKAGLRIPLTLDRFRRSDFSLLVFATKISNSSHEQYEMVHRPVYCIKLPNGRSGRAMTPAIVRQSV